MQFGVVNDLSLGAATSAVGNILQQSKNGQVVGISESMMSQQHNASMFSSAYMRRRQDKHVRNFKYLYEE